MNNTLNLSFSNSNEMGQNCLLDLIPKLLINKEKERLDTEKILEQYYYMPSLYKNLIEIGFYNTNISDNERMYIFIILKKLLKDKLLISTTNTTPVKIKAISEEKIEIIINNLKLHLMSYLNKGDFSQKYNKIIKDIVCLISNKLSLLYESQHYPHVLHHAKTL